eukprot:7873839-Alexandrium_andersonii.AAC.1
MVPHLPTACLRCVQVPWLHLDLASLLPAAAWDAAERTPPQLHGCCLMLPPPGPVVLPAGRVAACSCSLLPCR